MKHFGSIPEVSPVSENQFTPTRVPAVSGFKLTPGVSLCVGSDAHCFGEIFLCPLAVDQQLFGPFLAAGMGSVPITGLKSTLVIQVVCFFFFYILLFNQVSGTGRGGDFLAGIERPFHDKRH